MDDITLREEQEKDARRSGATADSSLPPGARQFPCTNCGAALAFQPGTTHLRCPYCGTENDIPVEAANDDHLVEHDYLAALEEENRRQEDGSTADSADAVKCGFCGAITTITERKTSDLCPYCGHPLAMQNVFKFKLNIQAVLPFDIDADKALSIYNAWLGGLWFAPNDFKRRATRGEAMKGVYMPYFTYDAATRTQYVGQRGDAYYVTKMVPVTVNGKTSMQPRQIRQIRWTRVRGIVGVGFDDILVPASQSVPMAIQYDLQPWDLEKLLPFRQEFLSGFVTETYQTSLKDGFEEAKQLMEPQINGAVARDIGGDEQRVEQKRTDYDRVTFKHILLPVWLSAYAYGGKTYRFTVNARTGHISGERPYSAVKIALAVLAGLAVLALFVMYSG